MSIVRDADFTVKSASRTVTTRVPSIEVQDRQLRADIYLTNLVVDGGRGLCIDVSRVHPVAEWHLASCGHQSCALSTGAGED